MSEYIVRKGYKSQVLITKRITVGSKCIVVPKLGKENSLHFSSAKNSSSFFSPLLSFKNDGSFVETKSFLYGKCPSKREGRKEGERHDSRSQLGKKPASKGDFR